MKNFYKKSKYKNAYALLLTMVIISVIMVIATGIYSSISKQLILSSTALDSQIAFFQSDTAGECALYATQVKTMILLNTMGTFDCGKDKNNNTITLNVAETSPGSQEYTVDPSSSLKGPCFRISVDESSTPAKVLAYGYNFCEDHNRQVERGIEINY